MLLMVALLLPACLPACKHLRTSWLLRKMVSAGHPCLLVGEPGTSKTVIINTYLSSLDASSHLVLGISFSSRTSSLDMQRALEGATEKRTKVR
jgi:dynein heavy chain, axonemal